MDVPIGQPVVVHRCRQQAECWAETEDFSGHVPATGCAGQPQSTGPPRFQGRGDCTRSRWEGLRGHRVAWVQGGAPVWPAVQTAARLRPANTGRPLSGRPRPHRRIASVALPSAGLGLARPAKGQWLPLCGLGENVAVSFPAAWGQGWGRPCEPAIVTVCLGDGGRGRDGAACE